MLIYPFQNDDTQSQLHTGLASKGVADRRAKQGRDSNFWVFLLQFGYRYFKGLGAWKKSGTNGSGEKGKKKNEAGEKKKK